MPSLAIIIPCYNEESRLKRDAIEKLVKGLDDATLFFVNDGSHDNTLGVLNELAAQFPDRISVISFSKNEGKAKAIAKGFRQVIDTGSFPYIGYMDADFSTPVEEFIKLYTTIREEKASFVFGSRIKKLNSGINRKPFRHLAGRVISTIIDLHFKLGIYDTQCGAKIFSSEVVSAVFDSPFYCNWLFDVEIFIRLKKKELLSGGIEQPLLGWKDIGGSKISLRTLPGICGELVTLARRY
jgi:glycosyltransferase involved in cell wall biosynthesis